MSKYYALIAGLPNISLEDSKITYSVLSFREELEGILTHGDKKLIDLFYLKFDNINLKYYSKWHDQDPDPRSRIPYEAFNDIIQAIKDGEKPKRNKLVPSYFVEFIYLYLSNQDKEEIISWEDRLSSLYYEYAMKCSNKFVANWFELNLNINNILAAITCRKFGLDKESYILGNNEVAQSICKSNARDFELGDAVDYLPELLRIAEETDLMLREKKIDLL